MSSAFVGTSVRVVKVTLRIGSAPVTCFDVTPERARLARFLEVATLQLHKAPMDVARNAQPIVYDAAQMASLVYRVIRQNDESNTVYAKDVAEQVVQSLTQTVTAVAPVAADGRYGRRLSVD